MKNETLDRYSESELRGFKTLLLFKLASAQKQLSIYTEAQISNGDNNTDDTSPTFDIEDGTYTSNKEANAELAFRQKKFIRDLRAALVRIENRTFGICTVTGKKISRERLLLVPHTTMSIEAKNLNQKISRERVR